LRIKKEGKKGYVESAEQKGLIVEEAMSFIKETIEK
jgi:hypothetical protein